MHEKHTENRTHDMMKLLACFQNAVRLEAHHKAAGTRTQDWGVNARKLTIEPMISKWHGTRTHDWGLSKTREEVASLSSTAANFVLS